MQSKLTLRLDDELIRKAKDYGRRRRKSVSQMVAEYFRVLDTTGSAEADATPPLTSSLCGLLNDVKVDEADYRARLEDKYS